MTYREKYNELIEYRKKFQPPKDAYTEKHHILPKSCGGTNDPENLVLLTGAEHFKAHYYLARALKEENDPNYRKMIFALTKMKQQIVKNSDLTDSQLEELGKIYEEARSEFGKAISEELKGKQFSEETRRRMSEAAKGKHLSEETRRKMSEVRKGRKGPMLGKHHTEEVKKKIGEAGRGRRHSEETKRKIGVAHKGQHHSEETIRKLSEAAKGKHPSEESKRKMSESLKGFHWYNNGSKNVFTKECPTGFVPGRLV